MEVKFNDYRFVRDELTLYQNDEIIPLKHTQALLLDFFLAEPENIHSKSKIMDTVWHDKDVSEQVVFQTISQLRALFGTNAIKTFSKKGYKWQLPLQQNPALNSTVNKAELTEQSIEQVAIKKQIRTKIRLLWPMFFISIFIIISAAFYKMFSSKAPVVFHIVQNQQITSINQSQGVKSFIPLAKEAITHESIFDVKIAETSGSVRQFFASPNLAWKEAKLPKQDWLLWTEAFPSTQGVFLNYGLSNGSVYWRGYVFAPTGQNIAQNLTERLTKLEQLGLFSLPTAELGLSEMTAMQHISPEDPDLLLLLANYYQDVKQFEVAMTYAEKVANLNESYSFSPYRAKAQHVMNNIHMQHQNYQLAANSLEKMADTLADTSVWPLKFEHMIAKAWLKKEQGQFEAMYDTLDKAIALSSEYKDPLVLFELQANYSILAKKANDVDKKYKHLLEAQALILKHKLNESNFAVVYYHFAIFTQDNNKAIPYLEKVLLLPRTIRNYWIIDHATELLVDQYIEQKDYHLAQSLLETLPESSKFLLSRAKLFHVIEKDIEARLYYEKAFESARLEHNAHMGVHAAFGLFQLTAHEPKVQAEYKDYLDRNAKTEWLDEQMNKLKKG